MKLRSGDPAFAPSSRTSAVIALILIRLNAGQQWIGVRDGLLTVT
jgi:hypothetical protein